MSTAKRLHYSYEQYLRLLEESDIKLEYCDGVIYAMVGGTPAHALLSAAAIGVLRQALLNRCSVSTSDLKVRIEATGLSTFPDASVISGELQTSPIDSNAVINPSLLVEVTSRSTEDYDRGDKLSHYKQIATLRAVLFISHRLKAITLVERSGASWNERELRSGEEVSVAEPAVRFRVDDIYAGIALDPK
jgi:Uma2 family endonuclease